MLRAIPEKMKSNDVQKDKLSEINSLPYDHQQLQHAFAVFSEASEQLSGVYQELQQQVAQLTRELALANGKLHQQLTAKEALSQRLSVLLAALPGGVVVLDVKACVEQVNPAAIKILGEPLLGISWDSVKNERLVSTTIDNEWHLKQSAMASQRRIRIESSPSDATGKRILLIHDITESHAMQEQIRRNQRLTSMGEMAANLAHQLRTPLATALLYATHLGNDALSTGDRRQFATKTIERLYHLEHLTNNMLRFVKGETMELESAVVSDLLTEIQQVIEPQMSQSNLRLIVHDDSRGVSAKVDHKALCGALINLIENAMQVSCPGDQIILTSSLEEDSLVFTVKDNGPGIDRALQERLFEPFFTTRAEGTGLGLAIVRGAIQSMGGKVQVNSLPNIGSEFVIRLPQNKGVF